MLRKMQISCHQRSNLFFDTLFFRLNCTGFLGRKWNFSKASLRSSSFWCNVSILSNTNLSVSTLKSIFYRLFLIMCREGSQLYSCDQNEKKCSDCFLTKIRFLTSDYILSDFRVDALSNSIVWVHFNRGLHFYKRYFEVLFRPIRKS